MLEPADQPSTKSTEPISPNRVQALLGIACAVSVAASLGLPGLNFNTSVQLLLVVAGFRLARAVHCCSTDAEWRVPMVLGLAGRAIPSVLLILVMAAVYQLVADGLDGEAALALISAATFTSNVVPFLADASFGAVDHLWIVALTAQAAVAAPWLLTARRARLGPRRRALVLFAVAAVLAAVRLSYLAVASVGGSAAGGAVGAGSWLTPPDPSWIGALAVWTSADALLVGMAIGTLPLANLHRNPTIRLVTPAVGGLVLVLLLPTVAAPAIDIGLRMAAATVFGGVILAANAISGLPKWLTTGLTNAWWHRLGSRALGLYLWHIPFAYGLSGGNPHQWHGPFVFALAIALTLAAATTTYRSIELPAQAAVASLASRWYRPEAILLPSPQPQRGKWVRWEDVSLDKLPIPSRRRGRLPAATRSDSGRSPADREPLGHRLWRSGDREVDLRPGSDLGGPRRSTTTGDSDGDAMDQAAATG